MFDHYLASGNETWLDAATGAWEMLHGDFEHVDGTSSLTEGSPDTDPKTGQRRDWPAKSYRIRPGTGTGETCCSSFWIKLNQRFHLLTPTDERFAAEIETTIYNALLRQMAKRPKRRTKTNRYNRWQSKDKAENGEDAPSLPPGIYLSL